MDAVVTAPEVTDADREKAREIVEGATYRAASRGETKDQAMILLISLAIAQARAEQRALDADVADHRSSMDDDRKKALQQWHDNNARWLTGIAIALMLAAVAALFIPPDWP